MVKDKNLPEPKGGPFERQRIFFEERFTPLQSRRGRKKQLDDPASPPREPMDEPSKKTATPVVTARSLARSTTRASAQSSADPVDPTPPIATNFRQNLINQYRKLQQDEIQKQDLQQQAVKPPQDIQDNNSPSTPAVVARSAVILPSDDPDAKPVNNWIPIGPSVLRQAQGATKSAASGRVVGISLAPYSERVYVATANGGIWRSQDMGKSWRSLMDAFDLDPTHRNADSLACGAIALVAGATAEEDVIYVGSGEGGGGSYFGVGPLISTDGGQSWETEAVKPGSPELAGSAFYALAVDPADSNRVVAATRKGLYRREPDTNGSFHWAKKKLPGARYMWTSSVVVTQINNTTTFYTASWGGYIYSSEDGDNWTQLGTQIPTGSRTTLAVQPANPNCVYAFVSSGHVYRFNLDTSSASNNEDNGDNNGNNKNNENDESTEQDWIQITGTPAADRLVGSQGNYDLSIAVDPADSNRIYIGGSTVQSSGEWSGALYRCEITDNHAENTYIGDSVHADIHTLVFTPDDNEKMWVGCDGGVYYTDKATTGDFEMFRACNTGLATMLINSLGQHPTEDSVLFAGTQDNGGQRFTGEEAWLYSSAGDSGYFVVNWKDPYKILTTYTKRHVLQSTDGGTRHSYRGVSVPIDRGESVLFYAPIAGAPYNPEHPEEADIVAFGSERVWISTKFGRQWKSIPYNNLKKDKLGDRVKCLQFASAKMLYAGTMSGRVYRFDQKDNGSWKRTRLDNKGNENILPLKGVVTDIAIDTNSSTGYYIYVSFGGNGDYRHIWHYSAGQWEARSGPGADKKGSLLDVQLNSIVVDPVKPKNLYVAADIGIWHSSDAGKNWDVFSQGLPDAAVTDLKLHGKSRLLRASTYGRGVFERTLDDAPRQGVDLYIRTTQLDQGRQATGDSRPDPTQRDTMTRHWRSPDIQLDTPDIHGNYKIKLEKATAKSTFNNTVEEDAHRGPGGEIETQYKEIDFLEFVDAFAKAPDQYAVSQPFDNNEPIHIYVQVHNRGVVTADNVKVTCLFTQSAIGLPLLPEGYATQIKEGSFVDLLDSGSGELSSIGTVTLDDIRVGFPKVAHFTLSSDQLPIAANPYENNHHSIIAIVHHEDDPFDSTERNIDVLTREDRKVAQKNQRVIQFSSPLLFPPPLVVPVYLHSGKPFTFNDGFNRSSDNGDEQSNAQSNTSNLTIKLNKYEGRVRLYLPSDDETNGESNNESNNGNINKREIKGMTVGHDFEDLKDWANKQSILINKLPDTSQQYWASERLEDLVKVISNPQMYILEKDEASLKNINIQPGDYEIAFLVLDRPDRSWAGEKQTIELTQQDAKTKEIISGMDLTVEIIEPIPDNDDSPIKTGSAFPDTIKAGSKIEWVSDKWDASIPIVWTVIPLGSLSQSEGESDSQQSNQTDASENPQISWKTQVERNQKDKLIYTIEITNHSESPVETEIRYTTFPEPEEEIFG